MEKWLEREGTRGYDSFFESKKESKKPAFAAVNAAGLQEATVTPTTVPGLPALCAGTTVREMHRLKSEENPQEKARFLLRVSFAFLTPRNSPVGVTVTRANSLVHVANPIARRGPGDDIPWRGARGDEAEALPVADKARRSPQPKRACDRQGAGDD